LIVALEFIPLNAFFPTFVSLVDLIVIVLRFLHPLNAPPSILVTVSGIVTLLRLLRFLNAFFEIAVTVYFWPSISIVFGTLMLFAFLFLDVVYVTSKSPVTLYVAFPEVAFVPFFAEAFASSLFCEEASPSFPGVASASGFTCWLLFPSLPLLLLLAALLFVELLSPLLEALLLALLFPSLPVLLPDSLPFPLLPEGLLPWLFVKLYVYFAHHT